MKQVRVLLQMTRARRNQLQVHSNSKSESYYRHHRQVRARYYQQARRAHRTLSQDQRRP